MKQINFSGTNLESTLQFNFMLMQICDLLVFMSSTGPLN